MLSSVEVEERLAVMADALAAIATCDWASFLVADRLQVMLGLETQRRTELAVSCQIGATLNDVAPGELVVIGAPSNDPNVDVGYTITPEVSLPITPTVGSVAYRSVGQDADGAIIASGSQLYLAVAQPPADVNTSYSFFGQIVEGTDILSSLTVSDTIESVTIEVK